MKLTEEVSETRRSTENEKTRLATRTVIHYIIQPLGNWTFRERGRENLGSMLGGHFCGVMSSGLLATWQVWDLYRKEFEQKNSKIVYF